MATFYTLLTDIGQAKIANAIALGQTIEITHLAVGDGGGASPTPESDATALVNEVRRAPINTSKVDGDNPNWIVVEQVLPPDVGGWTIREIGIFDVDGDLIGVGNYPETYKPILSEGSSRTQTVRFVLEVSDTAAVTLKVDPSVVLATREYVDQERAEHEASRSHPAATESLQGMIKLANESKALAGTDNTDAMTAARVFQAFNQFGLGNKSKDVTNTNLNYLENSGFYVGNNLANAPEDSTSWFYIICQQHDTSFTKQIAHKMQAPNKNTAWVRTSDGGLWGAWEKLLTGENEQQVGVNQTWQDVLSSRSPGITYTNSTGKPIVISVSADENNQCYLYIDGLEIIKNDSFQSGSFTSTMSAIVPDGSTYRVEYLSLSSIMIWSELR